jgi:hypothetical protein
MEQWKQTRDTRVAAAFGTLGMPIRLTTTIIEATGQQRTTFHIGLSSLDGTFKTSPISRDWNSGKLETAQPTHPFLTCLRALENRRSLLELLHKPTTTLRLVQIGTSGIWQYTTPGDELPGIYGHREVFRTYDVKLAAALATVGLPVLAIEEGSGRHSLILPRYGPPRADSLPPVDAADFATAWRTDRESIPWEEPFAQAARALHNRERLLDAIHRDTPNLLVRKPRSLRSAIISTEATPAAWDKVKEHFDR